jgi:dipeptide/tripeptide permease
MPLLYAVLALIAVVIMAAFINGSIAFPKNRRIVVNIVLGLIVVGIGLLLQQLGLWGQVVRMWGNLTNHRLQP